ncbi:MAG: hypothetical protein QXT73_01360 [Candidatus Methanomethylicaceae archaeon]
MKVLVACEESQVVTKAFRSKGLEAWSCDILPCSGGHPEWHLQCDVRDVLGCEWDMILAFPPCTHLAASGARWFERKRALGEQQEAIEFFLLFTRLSCQRVAIENPVGIMSRLYRKPDQIVHPWMFGDPYRKQICLWLKGLPLLVPTKVVEQGDVHVYSTNGKVYPKWMMLSPSPERGRLRSKLFPGIAEAMADQWGSLLLKERRKC